MGRKPTRPARPAAVALSLPLRRDVDAQALVDACIALNLPELHERGVDAARTYLQQRSDSTAPGPALALVADDVVPVGAGSVPVRVYRATDTDDQPVVVYLHGGGWVIASVEASDPFCRRRSAAADCVVVSVDYPLAPEHPFPAAIESAVAAIQWAAVQARSWGADPDRLVVLGDSAGGNLATVAVRHLSSMGVVRVRRQILAYPGTFAERTASGGHFGSDWPLTDADRRWFMDQYVADDALRSDPRVAPVLAELADLAGLPATTIVLSGCDPLLPEGLQYAQRLWQAGVSVDLHLFAGQLHGFLTMDEAILPRSREAVGLVANSIRSVCA